MGGASKACLAACTPTHPACSLACRAGEKRTPSGSGLFEATDSPTLDHLPPPSADKRRRTAEGGGESIQLGGGAPAAVESGFAGAEGRHGGERTQVMAAPELAHAVEGCAVPEPGATNGLRACDVQGMPLMPSQQDIACTAS